MLEFEGKFLLKDPEATIDSLCIADGDMLLLENKRSDKYGGSKSDWWNLVNEDVPVSGKCDNC